MKPTETAHEQLISNVFEACIEFSSRGKHRTGRTMSSLLVLHHIKGADEEVETSALIKKMGVSSAAMTGFLDDLVCLGLVKRRRGKIGEDRRRIFISITPEGKKFYNGLAS